MRIYLEMIWRKWMLVVSTEPEYLTPSPLSFEGRRQCPRAVWWVEEAPAAMLVPGSAESCWTTAAAKPTEKRHPDKKPEALIEMNR